MKLSSLLIPTSALLLAACSGHKAGQTAMEVNDTTSPLHLLKADYKVPYGELNADSIKATVDLIFDYINSVTPAKVVDASGEEVTDLTNLPDSAMLNPGTFRLSSYEWAVTYKALLDAAKTLGDKRYSDYVSNRVGFMANMAPAFIALHERTGMPYDGQMRMVCNPVTLDDSGAMSGAFMEAAMADTTLNLNDVIERYYNIVETKALRLPDGTISRNRPYHNSVWLDDMFMSIPAMVTRAKYTGDDAHLQKAVGTAKGFVKRMWMPEKNLFRHGYVEGLESQPEMAWARANGWAILTLCQILDALPENHPDRPLFLDIYKKHVKGLANLQSKDGFWHQLLDRNESFLETSATAIFAYSIAHGINEGWLEPQTYGPVAQLAWEALTTKISPKGEVEDVVVGTGMGFDNAYYQYRPVSSKAAHGYGVAIWAGSEMARLARKYYPRINDSALLYYEVDPEATTPIFSLNEDGKASEIKH